MLPSWVWAGRKTHTCTLHWLLEEELNFYHFRFLSPEAHMDKTSPSVRAWTSFASGDVHLETRAIILIFFADPERGERLSGCSWGSDSGLDSLWPKNHHARWLRRHCCWWDLRLTDEASRLSDFISRWLTPFHSCVTAAQQSNMWAWNGKSKPIHQPSLSFRYPWQRFTLHPAEQTSSPLLDRHKCTMSHVRCQDQGSGVPRGFTFVVPHYLSYLHALLVKLFREWCRPKTLSYCSA